MLGSSLSESLLWFKAQLEITFEPELGSIFQLDRLLNLDAVPLFESLLRFKPELDIAFE